jgi:vomeronasal 2 receptor
MCMIKLIIILSFLCYLNRYNFKNYQYILALQFAIEEINANPNLLPNISLGFDFYNVRYIGKYIHSNTFNWLTALGDGNHIPNYNCKKRNFTAALTGTSWITSAQIGTLLQLFKFPQVRKFGFWELRVSSLCSCYWCL